VWSGLAEVHLKGEPLIQPLFIRLTALRPIRGDADKAGKRGNIDEGFDPLHAGQSAPHSFVPGWLDGVYSAGSCSRSSSRTRSAMLEVSSRSRLGGGGGLCGLWELSWRRQRLISLEIIPASG
jgi:hypothetical protein